MKNLMIFALNLGYELTSEQQIFENEQKKSGEHLSKEILYKIEVEANRYDLLVP